MCDRCYFSVPDPSNAGAPLLTPPVPGGGAAMNAWTFADSFSRPMTLRHPHSRASSASRPSSPAHSPPGSGGGALARSKSRSRQGSATSGGSSSTAPSSSEYSTPSTSVERLPYGTSAGSSTSSAGTSPEELCIATAALNRRRKASLSRAASASRVAALAHGNDSGNGASAAPGLRASSVPPRRTGSGGTYRSKAVQEEDCDDESDASTEVEDDAPRANDFAVGPPVAAAHGEASDDDDDDDERHDETVRERRRLQQEFGSVGMTWSTF